jgi:hypothetical protein
MRRRWALLAALVAGCAGGGDPSGASETDTDTDGTSTSFGPTTFDESTTDDPSDPSDSNEASTAIASQSGEGSSSSGSSSGSTGCPVGTLGCPCDEGDPPCEEGLECADDVCAEPLCPDKEFEDNDAFNDAWDFGEFSDGDPPQMFESVLSGTPDVDWFTYSCTDTTFEEVEPTLSMETSMPFRACLYLDCVTGGNPLFDCPDGTTPE